MDYLPIDTATTIGTAVLHSLWQGAAVYCLFRLAMSQVEDPARLHNTGLLSLGAMALGFVFTLYLVWPETQATTAPGAGDAFQFIPPTSSESSAFTDLPWAAGLGYGYALGVLLYLAWLTFEHVRTQRLLRSNHVALPVEWQTAFRLAHARFAPRVKAGVYLSRHVATVVTVGILRPIVLYPVMLANQLSAEEAELILLHELAHLRRYDHLTIYAQQLLRALLFFHPTAHLLSRHIDTAREYACDDLVVAGSSRKAYAKTLLHLATQPISRPISQTTNAFAMSISKTSFTTRIQRLFGAQKTTKLPALLFAVPLALFVLTAYAISPTLSSDETSFVGENVTAAEASAPGATSGTAASARLSVDTIPDADPVPNRDASGSATTEDGRTTYTAADGTIVKSATDEDIAAIVANAIRDLPSEAELNAIVADAMKNMPSAEQLTAQVREAMKNMPSEAEIKRIVEDATKNVPTEAELRRTIDEAMKSVPTQAEIDEIMREARASVPSEAERLRIQADAQRALADAQRALTDAQRVQEDALRLQAEAQRNQDDTKRKQADGQRAQEESQRAQADAQRLQAEAQRAQAEAQRAQLDAQREQLDTQRAQVEAQRAQQDKPGVQVTTQQRREQTTSTTTVNGKAQTTTSGSSSKSVNVTADPNATDIDYFIDGRATTAREVNALSPDTIERVNVVKNEGERKVVRVTLKE